MALTEVSANALTTSSIALCASGVAADFVNAGVWFPPSGSVGIAIQMLSSCKPIGRCYSQYLGCNDGSAVLDM